MRAHAQATFLEPVYTPQPSHPHPPESPPCPIGLDDLVHSKTKQRDRADRHHQRRWPMFWQVALVVDRLKAPRRRTILRRTSVTTLSGQMA
eukprot:scaffold3860_cov114-Isochrysis_galbana.AAC.1